MFYLSKLNNLDIDNFALVKKSEMPENFPQSNDLNGFEKTEQSSLLKLVDSNQVPQTRKFYLPKVKMIVRCTDVARLEVDHGGRGYLEFVNKYNVVSRVAEFPPTVLMNM